MLSCLRHLTKLVHKANPMFRHILEHTVWSAIKCFMRSQNKTRHPPSTILSSKWEPPAYVAVALGKTLLLHRPASLSCISIHYLSWQRWAGLKIQSCLHQSRRTGCTASELRNCGRAKPSHVLSMVHWFFFFFSQNKKNIERPDGIYLPPYCKQRQRRGRRSVLGRWGREASPPVLAVTLATSRQQEKLGFLQSFPGLRVHPWSLSCFSS